MKAIKAFSQFEIRPLLGADFSAYIYAKRDLVRMRGPFVQAVLFAKKRSDWLLVIPTFYVAGANPADPVLFQTMSLPISGMDENRRWRFPPETLLDAKLAQDLVAQLERESPLSFVKPLEDDAIGATLDLIVRKGPHWASYLSRAFFNMCRGAVDAAGADLAQARKLFIKRSRYRLGQTPFDFEQVLMARFDTLQRRLQEPECVLLCRAEAEEHASRLQLPAVEWPPEWPTVAPPPAPRKVGWLDKLLRR